MLLYGQVFFVQMIAGWNKCTLTGVMFSRYEDKVVPVSDDRGSLMFKMKEVAVVTL